MSSARLIARMDIKVPNLIKGVNLEGLRKMGDPATFATKYYQEGIDEIIYMDIVASLYERNSLGDIVRLTTENVFIPLTVGGGIRTERDVESMLRFGADKVAINTAAVKQPEIISSIANRFGSQCMVLSIEAKEIAPGRWEVFTDNGRQKTGKDVLEWAREGVDRGAGEVLLTSVDREGTRKGFDTDLTFEVSSTVSVPVIASGGMGQKEHLIDVIERGKADAVSMADVLHYNRLSVAEMRAFLSEKGVEVRQP